MAITDHPAQGAAARPADTPAPPDVTAPGTRRPARWAVRDGGQVIELGGDWLTDQMGDAYRRLRAAPPEVAAACTVDASGIGAFDTGGAYVLDRLIATLSEAGCTGAITGLDPERHRVLALVQDRLDGGGPPPEQPSQGYLERIGRAVWAQTLQGYALLAFLGETLVATGRAMMPPTRAPWRSIGVIIQRSGADALPIVGLLSLLLGVVIAYQGGVQLKTYGASIFVVELTTLTLLREIGPMMAAIIVAGRTGSAYAAELATMRVTDEIDALRTLGIDPIERLVVPKLIGLCIALPLLTVFADAAGVVGGMLMAFALLDVPMVDFVNRIPQVVNVRHLLLGLMKAPVFAAFIVLVGCFQGMMAAGSADSVGRQTTTSVVQSIFLVIVIDAVFSIAFSAFKL